jgi:hypothetical protein
MVGKPPTPNLPAGASSESEEHTRVLLGAYQETLEAADDLPAIFWIPLRGEGLRRFIKVPHLRWFLRYFLSDHIRRGLSLLNRRFHASAALTGDSEANQANITAVEHYHRSSLRGTSADTPTAPPRRRNSHSQFRSVCGNPERPGRD